MKRIIRLISYICLHIMLAVFFIDTNTNDKIYSLLLGLVFGVFYYALRPSIDITRMRMIDRTYYYLLFALFFCLSSFIYKTSITYEWFDIYGFKIWLNVLAIILVLKTMYAFVNKNIYQKKNPDNTIKAKSLLGKKYE